MVPIVTPPRSGALTLLKSIVVEIISRLPVNISAIDFGAEKFSRDMKINVDMITGWRLIRKKAVQAE